MEAKETKKAEIRSQVAGSRISASKQIYVISPVTDISNIKIYQFNISV